MPGLVGFYQPDFTGQSEDLLVKMARALEPEAIFQVDQLIDRPIGLARVKS